MKFSHGLNLFSDNVSIKINEEEIFMLLDEMKTVLSIKIDNIFELNLDDEININYLHNCIGLYNTMIKTAKGSDIYFLVYQSFMIPYVSTHINVSSKFMTKYPNFYNKWIYAYQIS
jgi:hypothetical protein